MPREYLDAARGRGWRDFVYVVLLVALFPLAMSQFSREGVSLKDRIDQSLVEHPELRARVEALLSKQDVDPDQIIALFPQGRLAGAFLPRDSGAHWAMALLASGAFFTLLLLMLNPGHARAHQLILAGLFTATVGIVLLIAFQFVADVALSTWSIPRGRGAILWLILKFIGFSYYAAERPDYGFVLSFVGFTCGVGLCEELCKAIPILWLMRKRSDRVTWRGAWAWGLASGIGFGVAEGVMYSSRYYNGVSGAQTYIVRFASCVALHAVWSGSVATALYHKREQIAQAGGVGGMLGYGLVYAFVPMLLHGLYDTMLKKEYNLAALAVALASFVYLAAMIEWSRQKEIAQMEASAGGMGLGASSLLTT
jgi:RsiW-degrading membrane proteinase PrsW (M82 family)